MKAIKLTGERDAPAVEDVDFQGIFEN